MKDLGRERKDRRVSSRHPWFVPEDCEKRHDCFPFPATVQESFSEIGFAPSQSPQMGPGEVKIVCVILSSFYYLCQTKLGNCLIIERF